MIRGWRARRTWAADYRNRAALTTGSCGRVVGNAGGRSWLGHGQVQRQDAAATLPAGAWRRDMHAAARGAPMSAEVHGVGVHPCAPFVVELEPDLGSIDARGGDGMGEAMADGAGDLVAIPHEANGPVKGAFDVDASAGLEGCLLAHPCADAVGEGGLHVVEPCHAEPGCVPHPGVGDEDMAGADGMAEGGFGRFGCPDVGGDATEGAMVGIDVEEAKDGAVGKAFEDSDEAGAKCDGDFPHGLGLVDGSAEAGGDGIDLLEDEDLVVVAVVGPDADEAAGAGFAVPLVEVEGGVLDLGAEDGVGEGRDEGLEFPEAGRVREAGGEVQHAEDVALGVMVAVVDFHAGEAGHVVVHAFLGMGEEDHAGAGADGLDEARDGLVDEGKDGVVGVGQEAAAFGAGNE